MSLNKLEAIQGLTNLKQLKPISPLSPREEWMRGEIVNSIDLISLSARLLLNQSIFIKTISDHGERALQYDNTIKVIKHLFECIDEGWMLQKEFNQIKKVFNIKLDKIV